MSAIGDRQEFELTADHVTLLNRAYICWEGMEWGMPGIDGKRPFGGGDMPKDICEILGWVVDWDDVTPRQERELLDRARTIYRELEVALQIVLRAQTFEPGTFVTNGAYDRNWREV